MANRTLVVGGSGFLGSALCRRLLQANQSVVSLSRRGSPPQASRRTHWAQHVQWEKGDALDISSYNDLLNQCTSVVHCVGQISELPYKNLFDPESKDGGDGSFERVNRDTAIFLASAVSSHACVKSMVFVSAAPIPFPLDGLVDNRYTESKRSAENAVLGCSSFRPVVLRPGFMFGDARPWSVGVAAAAATATQLPQCVAHFARQMSVPPEAAKLYQATVGRSPIGRFIDGFRAATEGSDSILPDPEDLKTSFISPLRIDTVAEAAVQAILDPTVRGVQDVENIKALSDAFMCR